MSISTCLPQPRQLAILLILALAGCIAHRTVSVSPPPAVPVRLVVAPTTRPAAPPTSMAHPLDPQPQVTAHALPARKVLMMEVTAYCPCKICCGRRAHGVTASGYSIRYNGGAFVAADTHVLPFQSRIIVPGYNGGSAIPVIDRGGDITGNRLDVFFKKHAEAEKWGRRMLAVTVVK